MYYNFNEETLKKILENVPEWLRSDIENIVEKHGINVRLSHVISLLYQQYSFNFAQLINSLYSNSIDSEMEWRELSRQRLNIIDNNVDVIDLLLKDIKEKAKKELEQSHLKVIK